MIENTVGFVSASLQRLFQWLFSGRHLFLLLPAADRNVFVLEWDLSAGQTGQLAAARACEYEQA